MINMTSPFKAFTQRYYFGNGLKLLISQVSISSSTNMRMVTTRGLWDTGANKTLVSPHIIQELGLISHGINSGETSLAKIDTVITYKVNIGLPNKELISDLEVGGMKGDPEYFDILIGMDIICLGDFSITNFNKETILSFRIPSIKIIDFENE